MKSNCIIFDVDGTLFDTGEGIRDCARYALRTLGADFPEEKLNLFIGPSLFYSFHETVGLNEEQSHKGVELYRSRYQNTGIDLSRPYEGVEWLLDKLFTLGYTLSIASSKPQPMIEYLLHKHDFARYFTAVIGAQFATVSSDKSEYVRSASLGERNIMVGDTHFDIEGAHKAGVPAVAVTYGFGAVDTLQEAEYIAASPAAVFEATTRHFRR